ncbi:hypothetical protein CAC42_5843 [Sphaceloma murrayae]|uniref:DUF7707 domain-containing protein n=1 Tax=Sphaceloma murrayae TaxID=2082308 RepID=A0A2K1QZM7_9PEZI|nr:hypothetical protein CAC42_5843 [Sphaceloma murrayae]
MHFQSPLLAIGLLSGLTVAQYNINPTSVPQSLRQYWCDSQITQCPLICLQYNGSTGAIANDCDASNLSYECVCSTGISPNSTEYSQTLPYFVCTEWGNQCVTAQHHGSDRLFDNNRGSVSDIWGFWVILFSELGFSELHSLPQLHQ